MRKHLHWILTASLGISSTAFLGCEKSSTSSPQSSNTSRSNQAEDSKIINNKADAAKTAGSMIPGDQIEYHVTKLKRRRNMWWYRGEAKVGGEIVAEAELGAMIADA